MFSKFLSLISLVFLAGYCESKVYGQCELAQTLLNNGIPQDQIGTWLCIASHESNFDTTAINQQTWDYGIFQISSIYWCDQGSAGCGIACQDLLGDDITIDITCIKVVYDEFQRLQGNGFLAWTTYQFCNGDNTSWTNGCFNLKANQTLPAK